MLNKKQADKPTVKKNPSKKQLIREIIEMPTRSGGEYDHVSLERTNVKNLLLILEERLAK
mgnify:CR=1|jgi:hypothetical protein|tara:strand:- start:971 stop:1150 length:180 start_codon:yes stop_codon:yes gene_type:complete